ncbi:MAG TPA: lipopolysaccharide biosynthesis protein [Chthoniobacterales bacterium]|nr:lipopolysaccharide biosynthesis protein [Chthoniobacterales bacterium]
MEPPSPVPDPALAPLETPSPEQSVANIKRSSARGGAITMVSQGAAIILQLTSTMVLARLLGPAEYGVIAMVAAVTAFAGLFRDLGLSASTIQRAQINNQQLSTLYWVNVTIGALLTGVTAASAPLVAWFYGRPELVPVTIALAFTFVLGSFGTQQSALLNRNMQFGRLAIATLSGAFLSVLVSIILAFQGQSYWSLVWGNLAGAALTSILLNVLSGWRPGAAVRGSGLRSMLAFGANITAFDLVNYFQRNLDNILIGRFAGANALGLYSRAYALLMFPVQNIRGPINAVAFPALSRLQDRPAEFRAYYLSTTRLIAFLSMPLTAFLFVTSDAIIRIGLGPEWLRASSIFSYLAIAAFIQPASGLGGSLLLARGDSRRYFQCGLFNAAVLSLSFVVGLPWGPEGVALAYAVGNYVVLYPWLRWAFQGSPVTFGSFAAVCAWPATVSVIAAAVVFASRFFIRPGTAWLELLLAGVLFVIVVVPPLFLTAGGKAQVTLVRNLIAQLRSPNVAG